KVIEEGSGFASKELEPLLFSTDRNFRPVDIRFGPDGALYIVDWFNPLIGHMQHSIRDPGRDHIHGRIWRISYKGRPLVKSPRIHGEPIPKLLDLFKEYEDRTRYQVRAELRERKKEDVLPAVMQWVMSLKEDDPEHEHLLLEALWVQQNHNGVDKGLLLRLLRAKDYHARAAATRVLRHLYSPSRLRGEGGVRGDEVLKLLEDQANDVHPRVRLEAVVACSVFKDTLSPSGSGQGEGPGDAGSKAADIALQALKHPMDYYLDYALKETMTTLEPYWKPALAAGKPFAVNNPAGANYVLGSVSTAELIKLPRTSAVLQAMLTRDGVLP